MKKLVYLFILFSLIQCKKDTAIEPVKPYTDPVAFYTFSGNCEDKTKYKNNGNVFGAVLTTDSLSAENSAYYFDGKSYIEIPDNDILDIATNKLTITAWIKPTETIGTYVVEKTTYMDNQGQLMQGGGPFSLDIFSGQTRAVIYANDNKSYVMVTGTTNIKKDIWQHIAVSWDGKKVNLYYNGQLESSQNFKHQIQVTNGNLYIGAYKWVYPNASFKGSIDNVRIYNRSLTTEEIQELYNNYK